MKEQKKTILSFLLPYAIGLLLIRLAIDFGIKVLKLGYQGESYGGFIALFIAFGFIYITVANYKKFQNNGELMFSEGVRVGVGLLLIVGCCFTTYLMIYGKFIDPSYQEGLAQEAAQLLSEKNPDAETDRLTAQKPQLVIGFFMSILKYIFIGIIGGVVSAAILKTEK